MKTNIEESYILREYYKGFRPEQVDLIKIKEKINKINRESILSYVIEQDKQIYDLIAENYQNTYEILDKITDHINSLNIIKKAKTAKSSENLFYMVRYNSDDEDKTNNTTITSNNDFCTEPIAVIKINGILNQNQNKIQEYSNEITARKNVIKKKNGNVFFFEQTLTNYSCKGKIYKLHPKYNCYTLFFAFDYKNLIRWRKPTIFYTEKEVAEAKEKPAIIHFTRNFIC